MMVRIISAAALLLLFITCHSNSNSGNLSANIFTSEEPASKDILDELMDTTLVNGFDFPIGDENAKGSYTSPEGKTYDGWYVATKCGEEYDLGIHTGEDWNGSGGGNTDIGQPVYATAAGEVVHAAECPSPWGNVVMIRHKYFENGEVKTVYSQYSHLKEIDVKKGQRVSRRQKIGAVGQGNHQEYPAHLHFEIRNETMKDYAVDYWPSSNGKTAAWVKQHYEQPSEFVNAHRSLVVPSKESTIAIAVKHKLKCLVYKNGKLYKTYEIGLGQEPKGHKQKQGDLRTPEGAYYVCEKTKGPFSTENGQWANAYLGVRWIRLNYPNEYDAARGLKDKLITKEQCDAIKKACAEKKIPLKNTALGGGIGIHGWITPEWTDDDKQRALTWGCISMHNKDLEEMYDVLPMKSWVVVVP
jgi:murein DD-endopeptidase MepM/ murein hydrolase activator NlpD